MKRLLWTVVLAGLLSCGVALAEPEIESEIQVTYFHNTFRCQTCLKLESLADEAIRENFAEILKSDRLEWSAVNMQDPGNEHYADEYKLDGPSLVMFETIGGKTVRWKNLDRIWECVDSPEVYHEYVRAELNLYLEDKEAAKETP